MFLQMPNYLQRAYWADECAIEFSISKMSTKVKVYCDSRQYASCITQSTCRMKPGRRYRTITVRVIAAVNAIVGPAYLEFTTGTTDIKRMVLPDKAYKVSIQLYQVTALAAQKHL
jgi:hypothetical protein